MAKTEKWSRDGSSRAAGFRSLRLEELFREEMNSLLEGEVSDPRLENVRVTHVELSRDGSSARVWFARNRGTDAPVAPGSGGAFDADDTREAFERASGFFRSRLCDAVSLKRFPELRFRYDPVLVTDPYPNE
jgi:ribosome-binding factor A